MYHGLTSNLILVLLFVLIILVIFGCSQRSLLYFPSNEIIDISNHNDTGLKEVELTTSDGLVLKSWFKEPNTPKGFTILIFHGNAGHIGDRVEKFKRFIDADHGLLFLEYRGYGGNPGKPTEKGLYSDANAALNFLSKQHIFSEKIILYGESLGCGIAAKLSSENTFAATILEAPYTSIADVDDVTMAHYLTRTVKVAAIPISVFYDAAPGQRVVRLCFAKDDATLREAASRLSAVTHIE